MTSRSSSRLDTSIHPGTFTAGVSHRKQLLCTVGVLFAFGIPPGPLAGQLVRGEVVDSVTWAGLPGVLVRLIAANGLTIDSTTSDPIGLFQLRAPFGGRFQLQAIRWGFRTSTFPAFDVADRAVKEFRLLVARLPLPAAGLVTDTLIANPCPEEAVEAGEGVLMGVVTDSGGVRVPDADVIVAWSPGASGLDRLLTTVGFGDMAVLLRTDAEGLFVACGLPPSTPLRMHATTGDQTLSEFVSIAFSEQGIRTADTLYASTRRVWFQELRLTARGQRTAGLSGTVTGEDHMPVEGAEVQIARTTFLATTDRSGQFRLHSLPPGLVQVFVRAIGYQSKRLNVRLRPGTQNIRRDELRLQLAPTTLEPIVVEGRAPTSRRPLQDFWRRRAQSTGHFITREEFMAQGSPQVPSDVLKRMGVVSTRGELTLRRTAARGGMARPSGSCPPLLFMDGRYAPRQSLDQIPLVDVEAIEVYTSAASTPLEFARSGSVCGVISVWTR